MLASIDWYWTTKSTNFNSIDGAPVSWLVYTLLPDIVPGTGFCCSDGFPESSLNIYWIIY
jgi:hypothetical protein